MEYFSCIQVLHVHGGPGDSVDGYGDLYSHIFPENKFFLVEIDQRGCGKSKPSVADVGFVDQRGCGTSTPSVADVGFVQGYSPSPTGDVPLPATGSFGAVFEDTSCTAVSVPGTEARPQECGRRTENVLLPMHGQHLCIEGTEQESRKKNAQEDEIRPSPPLQSLDPSQPPTLGMLNMKFYADITIDQMAQDFEIVRKHLGNVEKWLVFGGSWGSTLATFYAETYPEHALGLIIQGVFLNSRPELEQAVFNPALYEEEAAAALGGKNSSSCCLGELPAAGEQLVLVTPLVAPSFSPPPEAEGAKAQAARETSETSSSFLAPLPTGARFSDEDAAPPGRGSSSNVSSDAAGGASDDAEAANAGSDEANATSSDPSSSEPSLSSQAQEEQAPFQLSAQEKLKYFQQFFQVAANEAEKRGEPVLSAYDTQRIFQIYRHLIRTGDRRAIWTWHALRSFFQRLIHHRNCICMNDVRGVSQQDGPQQGCRREMKK